MNIFKKDTIWRKEYSLWFFPILIVHFFFSIFLFIVLFSFWTALKDFGISDKTFETICISWLVFSIITIPILFFITIKRLRDAGMSSWFVLISLPAIIIPIINIWAAFIGTYFSIFLAFIPSKTIEEKEFEKRFKSKENLKKDKLNF